MNGTVRRAALWVAVVLALVVAGPAAAKKKPKAVMPSCGDTLTASVVFTADLDCSGYGGDALTVGANNITIDLKGHTLSGPVGKDTYSGIYTAGYNGTKILNGTIQNFAYDVHLYVSSDAQISGMTFLGDGDGNPTGVYDDYGAGSRIQKSMFGTGVYYGIYGYYTSGVFTHNTFTNDGVGVEGYYDTGDVISSNGAMGVPYAFESDYSYGETFANNLAVNPTDGVYSDCDTYGNATVVNNTVINPTTYGVYVYDCYNSATYTAPWTVVSGNKAIGGPDSGSAYGFYDYYSLNATYSNNVAKGLDDGFFFDYPTGFSFEANTANSNADDGVYAENNYYYYNFFDASYNIANNNGSYGFYAGYGAPGTSNHASGNASWNCYDFSCPGSAAPVFGGSAPMPPAPVAEPPRGGWKATG
jgi:hypothetical protein